MSTTPAKAAALRAARRLVIALRRLENDVMRQGVQAMRGLSSDEAVLPPDVGDFAARVDNVNVARVLLAEALAAVAAEESGS